MKILYLPVKLCYNKRKCAQITAVLSNCIKSRAFLVFPGYIYRETEQGICALL